MLFSSNFKTTLFEAGNLCTCLCRFHGGGGDHVAHTIGCCLEDVSSHHSKGTTRTENQLHKHKKHIVPIRKHPIKEKPTGTKKDNLQTPTQAIILRWKI